MHMSVCGDNFLGFPNSCARRQPWPGAAVVYRRSLSTGHQTMSGPCIHRSGIPMIFRVARFASTCCALITLAACGGSGGNTAVTSPSATSPPVTTPPPSSSAVAVDAADAARFLDQATFGVTASDMTHVQSIGFDAYINEQLAYAPTQYTGYSYTPHTAPAGCVGDGSSPPDASALCAA
jgi:hypothetical protein